MPLSDEVGAVKMGGLMITAPIVRLTRVPDDSNRYSHAIRINDILFFFLFVEAVEVVRIANKKKI